MSTETRTLLHIWILIAAIALMVRILTALPMQQPGYMDAYYYFAGAERLGTGDSFIELVDSMPLSYISCATV